MKTRKGAAMLYAVILSVVCATLVGGVLRMVAQGAEDQSKREKALRARAFADEQLAVMRSRGKAGTLTVPGSISRTGTGLSSTGSFSLSATRAGMVDVEQAVSTGGRTYLFRDSVAIPNPIIGSFSFATFAYGADNFNGGLVGAQGSLGVPDWTAADLNTSLAPVGRTTLSASGYFDAYEPPPGTFNAFAASLGLTQAQLAGYEFIAFSVANSTGPDFANSTWEFWKGNSRLRVASNATGVLRATSTTTAYQELFGLGAPPFGANTVVRVILFDFDTISGGPGFKAITGQQRVIIWTTSTTNAPRIDAIARLDGFETGPIRGILHEMGWPVRNNEANSFSTVLTRTVLSMPDNAGSGTQDVPLGSVSDNYGIYHGQLTPPTTGNYQFRFWTDDGSRLWVNDQLMVSAWWPQGPSLYTSGNIALTANVPVPIWYEWWDWGGAEGRRVEWLPPGGSWQLIPDQHLTPGNGTEPLGRGHWSFNDGVSTGWTLNGIRTSGDGGGPWGVPNAAGIVSGQFLGDFGGNNARPELDLGTVAAGRIIVTYEMFINGGWESSGGNGPDTIRLRVNGSEITNYYGAQGGTSEIRTTLPFLSLREPGGGWRNMRLEFQHSGGPLRIQWDKLNNGGDNINNESFLLDNVMVRRVR